MNLTNDFREVRYVDIIVAITNIKKFINKQKDKKFKQTKTPPLPK